VHPGGRQVAAGRLAELRRGGAIAAAAKLIGALRFLVSEHQKQNQDHGEIEERAAGSPMESSRAEGKQGARFAAGTVTRFSEIRPRVG